MSNFPFALDTETTVPLLKSEIPSFYYMLRFPEQTLHSVIFAEG